MKIHFCISSIRFNRTSNLLACPVKFYWGNVKIFFISMKQQPSTSMHGLVGVVIFVEIVLEWHEGHVWWYLSVGSMVTLSVPVIHPQAKYAGWDHQGGRQFPGKHLESMKGFVKCHSSTQINAKQTGVTLIDDRLKFDGLVMNWHQHFRG